MTPPRKAHHNSHYAISPALIGRDVGMHTRQLSGHSVSASRHSANGIVAHVMRVTQMGSQMDPARFANSPAHRAALFHDETFSRASRGCAAGSTVKSIVFHGGVASWPVVSGGVSCSRPVRLGTNTGPKMDPKTEPRTEPKKPAVLRTDEFRFATSRGSHRRAGPNNSSCNAPAAVARPPSDGCPEGAGRQVKQSASWSRTSWCGSNRSPRCAGAFPVRSTVLRCVGGVSCPLPNRARCRRRGLGERFEQVFEEIRRPNDCRNSAASASRSGPTKRQTSSWPSASAARSVLRNSTSPAIVSPLTKLSWSCSTNSGPASGPWVEGEPRECDGSAWDRLPPLVNAGRAA